MADFAVIYRCFKSLYFLPENLLAYADATSRLTANSILNCQRVGLAFTVV